MSEHNSTDDEINVNSTVTHIRNEINFIHAETYNARKALLKNLSDFTKRFEAIDGRLNRIEHLLLNHADGEVQNVEEEISADEEDVNGESNDKTTQDDQTIHRWGGGSYERKDVDETNTKTIANSRPERAKRAIKQPDRYVPETKKTRKDKAVEIKEEDDDNRNDRQITRKKRKASEPDAGKASTAPKKRVKGL